MVKLEENAHGNEVFPASSSGRGSEGRGSEEGGGLESDFAGLDDGPQEEMEPNVVRGETTRCSHYYEDLRAVLKLAREHVWN